MSMAVAVLLPLRLLVMLLLVVLLVARVGVLVVVVRVGVVLLMLPLLLVLLVSVGHARLPVWSLGVLPRAQPSLSLPSAMVACVSGVLRGLGGVACHIVASMKAQRQPLVPATANNANRTEVQVGQRQLAVGSFAFQCRTNHITTPSNMGGRKRKRRGDGEHEEKAADPPATPERDNWRQALFGDAKAADGLFHCRLCSYVPRGRRGRRDNRRTPGAPRGEPRRRAGRAVQRRRAVRRRRARVRHRHA